MSTQTDTQKAIVIDAAGERIGRLAARVAVALRGKDTPQFAPHKLSTQKVVVYNTDKLDVPQKKRESDVRWWHTGYPGGIRSRVLEEEMRRDSREVVRRAVYGMLPKNKLRDKHIQNLTLHAGELPQTPKKT